MLIAVAEDEYASEHLARDPGWVLARALSGGRTKAFAASWTTSTATSWQLWLGKKTDALYARAVEPD